MTVYLYSGNVFLKKYIQSTKKELHHLEAKAITNLTVNEVSGYILLHEVLSYLAFQRLNTVF